MKNLMTRAIDRDAVAAVPSGYPALIALDPQGRIRLVTGPGEQLLGRSAEEVYGLPCHQVLACRDQEGQPLCGRCGFCALASIDEGDHQITLSDVQVAHRSGRYQDTDVSSWYLPQPESEGPTRILLSIVPRTFGADGPPAV